MPVDASTGIDLVCALGAHHKGFADNLVEMLVGRLSRESWPWLFAHLLGPLTILAQGDLPAGQFRLQVFLGPNFSDSSVIFELSAFQLGLLGYLFEGSHDSRPGNNSLGSKRIASDPRFRGHVGGSRVFSGQPPPR